MNALKELLEKKRQAAQALQVGDRKYAKQAELEEQRHKRLREEEQKERQVKVSVYQEMPYNAGLHLGLQSHTLHHCRN